MEVLDLIKYILVPILLAYIGYNERDKLMIKQKLNKTPTRDDVNELIVTHLKEHAAEIRGLKGSHKRVETKIDKVIDLLIEGQ